MKIVAETNTRLVIQHKPIGNWLSGSLLLICGLSFWIYSIAFDFTSLSLTCTRLVRPEIKCELKRFTFLGSMNQLKIFDPQQAYIQTKTGSKGSKSYQIIIVNNLAEFPLLPQVSYQENQALMMKFNDFLQSSESSLILQQNQRNYLFWISLFMVAFIISGGCLAMSSATTCIFYRTLNQVYIERKGLLGKRVIEYPLEEIASFDIQKKQIRYSQVYQALILFKNGQKIPINSQYTNKKSVENVMARVRYFLTGEVL